MKITDLSKFSRCFIRQRWVVSTPEEQVRQALLRKMVEELHFPRGLLSVERGNRKRRTDIVCYTQKMRPLVLIECKALSIEEEAIQQAFGYNETILAPFVTLAGREETLTFWFEGKTRKSVPFLPVYEELLDAAKRL